jgi:hypothetical protein
MDVVFGAPGTASHGPLEFVLRNAKTAGDSFAYVYMTANPARDAEWGVLKLTIENKFTAPVELTGASQLDIFLPSALFGKAELEKIRLAEASQPRWELRVEDDALALKLHGQGTLRLAVGEKTELTLVQVFAAGNTPSEGAFVFEWSRFDGIDDESESARVLSQLIPDTSTNADLGFAWVSREEYEAQAGTVYTTPYETTPARRGIANRLLLRITNNKDESLENAGAYFRVTFFTEESGRFALLTRAQLAQVGCRPVQPLDEPWLCKPDTTGESTSWLIEPVAGTKNVFSRGKFVTLEFSNLVTCMAGDGTNSPVIVRWGGIKGHNPGQHVEPVTRLVPRSFVLSYAVKKDGVALHDGDTVGFRDKLTLQWSAFAADGCRVAASPAERLDPGLPSPASKDSFPELSLNDYTLTPEITLPTGIRTGNASPFRVRVLPARAKLDVVVGDGGIPRLVWECTDGRSYLSGPSMERRAVAAKDQLNVNLQGRYKIECVGGTTAEATAFAPMPHPMCDVWLGSWGGGRWTTRYATACEAEITLMNGQKQVRRELSGSVQESVMNIKVTARGNGTAVAEYGVGFTASPDAPSVSFSEEKLPTGTGHRVTWKISEPARFSTTQVRPSIVCESTPGWGSNYFHDDVVKEYGGHPRAYKISVSLTPDGEMRIPCFYKLTVTPNP